MYSAKAQFTFVQSVDASGLVGMVGRGRFTETYKPWVSHAVNSKHRYDRGRHRTVIGIELFTISDGFDMPSIVDT